MISKEAVITEVLKKLNIPVSRGSNPALGPTYDLVEAVWNAAMDRASEEAVYGDLWEVEPVMLAKPGDTEEETKVNIHACIQNLKFTETTSSS